MKTIPNVISEKLRIAQDRTAKMYAAYPGLQWQINFQEQWLVANGYPSKVIDEDGLIWGSEEEFEEAHHG